MQHSLREWVVKVTEHKPAFRTAGECSQQSTPYQASLGVQVWFAAQRDEQKATPEHPPRVSKTDSDRLKKNTRLNPSLLSLSCPSAYYLHPFSW